MTAAFDPLTTVRCQSPFTGSDRYATSPHGDEEWFGMTLAEMRDFVWHLQPAGSPPVAVAYLDGMLTAWVVGPTPVPPGRVVELLVGASPDEGAADELVHFSGAIFARYTEILHALAASPHPNCPGNVYDVEKQLAGAAPLFQPILNLPGEPPDPVNWACGFHQVIEWDPSGWQEVMSQHPRYYLSLPHIMFFKPNRAGYSTNKAIRNHSEENIARYRDRGLAIDAITLYWQFLPVRTANEQAAYA
jgi:hypothetical protein